MQKVLMGKKGRGGGIVSGGYLVSAETEENGIASYLIYGSAVFRKKRAVKRFYG